MTDPESTLTIAPEQLAERRRQAQGEFDAAARRVAFAGIAVAWVFRETIGDTNVLAPAFRLPLLCFVVCLAANFVATFVFAWLFGQRPGFFETPGDRKPWEEFIFQRLIAHERATKSSTVIPRFRLMPWLNGLTVLSLALGYGLLIVAIGRGLQFG